MLNQTQSVNTNSQPTQAGSGPPDTLAQQTLDANRGPTGLDIGGIKRDLDRARLQDPELGAQAAATVEAQLTPVQRGELASARYTIDAPDGGAIAFASDAPRVADYRAMPAGTDGRALYDRLDRVFGDGSYATDDGAAIQTGLTRMIAGGQTLAQVEAQAQPQAALAANDTGPDLGKLALDLTQIGLDVVGIFEPTPFADLTNAGISVGRGIFSGSWSGFGEGLLQGGISVLGVAPGIGDLAKVGKIGKWAETVANAVEAAASNPAARQALEPALREIRDAVNKIPQGVLDTLPASASDAIGRMKAQLDEFFGVGARQADNAAGVIGDTANLGRTVRINGQDVTIGAAPAVGRRADGAPTVRNANGDEVTLRQPATYDSRTVNADGTVTYEKAGNSVRYDANGLPLFNSRADVYLPPEKLAVNSRSTHFTESNRLLARNSDEQLRGAGFTDADIAKLRSGETPDNFTWHHHQDVGRMQLVRTNEHDLFSGGHSGGWSLWGDARRFTVE